MKSRLATSIRCSFLHMNLGRRILVSTLNQNQDVKGKCQMNRKKAGVVFIVLLTFVLAGQALAQGQETEFKSNADDLTKIRSVVEEFRQDIIHKDGYALTKLILNPDVLFHSINSRKKLIAPANITLSSMGLARASRWICEIPRYVEGQTRREILQH